MAHAATYDETISRALDVFERVDQDIPLAWLNWFFDHAETISEQSMDRIAALGGGISSSRLDCAVFVKLLLELPCLLRIGAAISSGGLHPSSEISRLNFDRIDVQVRNVNIFGLTLQTIPRVRSSTRFGLIAATMWDRKILLPFTETRQLRR